MLNGENRPEIEIQIVDQMEILKIYKPDNEIEYIEELNIPRLEKEPLFIENVDYLAIVVGQNFRSRIRNKSLRVEERDSVKV